MMSEEFEDDAENEDAKKIMFVLRRAPHGNIHPYEGLEVMLIMAAYDQKLSVVFIDDGVYVLKKGQDTSGIGIKEFSKTFKALPDYDIEQLYVDRESMEARGLTEDDLISEIEVKDRAEILQLMQEQDVLMPY